VEDFVGHSTLPVLDAALPNNGADDASAGFLVNSA